jgi:NarL family two-component system response regulator YdfI
VQRRLGDTDVTSVFIIAASDVVRAGLESLITGEPGFTIAGSAADLSELAAQVAEGASPHVVIFDAESHGEEMPAALRTFIEDMYEPGSSALNDPGFPVLDELRSPALDVTQTVSLRSAGQPHLVGGDHNIPQFLIIGAERADWIREVLRAGVVRATLPRTASSGEIIAALLAISNGLIALDPGTLAAVISQPTSTGDDSAELPDYSGRSDLSDQSDAQSYAARSPSIKPALDPLTPREREVLDMLAEGLSNKEIAWRMKISEHTVKFHVSSIFSKLRASTRTEAVMHGIRQGLIMM